MVNTVGVRLDCSARWGIKQNEPAPLERSPTARQCPKRRRDLLYSLLTQGNDADSFGAIGGIAAGGILWAGVLGGALASTFFDNDDIHTALAWFYERSLSKLAKRMGELPKRVAAEITQAL